MKEKEKKLLEVVRAHRQPEKAELVAEQIITDFLRRLQSYPEPFADFHLEPAEKDE